MELCPDPTADRQAGQRQTGRGETGRGQSGRGKSGRGTGQRDGQRRHRTKQHTGGAGKRMEEQKKESDDLKMKLIIIVAVVVVLVGGAVGAAVSFLQGSSVCNDPELLTDPVEISECLVVNCKFDVRTCTLPCPMGYSTKGGDDPCPKSCKCSAEGSFEGDIQFYDDDIPELLGKYGYVDKDDEEFSLFVGSALYVKGKILWDSKALPSGRIPIGYKLDRFLTASTVLKRELAKTSKMYSDNTCIDIEPYDREKHGTHYVDITLGRGCTSMVGYKKDIKQQKMSLQYGCHYVGTVIHEFLHTLGFYHEQSRPDRDDFVKIHLDNVKDGNAHNFQKSRAYFVKDLKSPYDLQSILHYNAKAFTKNGQPTITHAGSERLIDTQGRRLSEKDISELNAFLCKDYEFTNKPATTRAPTPTTRSLFFALTQRGVTRTRRWPYTTKATTTKAKAPGSGLIAGDSKWPLTTTLPPTTTTTTTTVDPEGGMSPWGAWQGCSATCGPVAQQIRARWCDNPAKGCNAVSYEREKCKRKPCSEKKKWAEWGEYGACTTTCGTGMQLRYRKCLIRWCPGRSVQAQTCTSDKCDGSGKSFKVAWGQWAQWGPCSRSCKAGYKIRQRFCRKGDSFSHGCPGRSTGLTYCNFFSCTSSQANDPPSQMFGYQSTSIAHLCSGANSDVVFIFGDFNGDRNVDVMCGSQDGGFEVGLATSNGDINTASWRGGLDGCVVQSGQIAVGDFNGDAKSDIVCVDHIKKRTTVRLSNNGQFPTGEGYSGSFCTDDSDWLIPLDIDGDNKWDLMCSHSNRDSDLLMNTFSL